MSITSLYIENFRAFEEATQISIRPLTLVFGGNSAGKSSLLRTLPLIADSTNHPRTVGLNLGSPATRGAAFSDLRCRSTARAEIVLGIGFDTDECSECPAACKYTIQELTRTKRQAIQQLEVEGAGSNASSDTFEWILPDSEDALQQSKYSWVRDQKQVELDMEFSGLRPRVREPVQSVQSTLDSINRGLDVLRANVHWLGAVRKTARRLYRTGGWSGQILHDGSGFAEFLAQDTFVGGDLVSGVSSWLRKMANCDIAVSRIVGAREEYFTLNILPIGSPSSAVNLLDTGEGLTQVLPVITLITMACNGSLGPAPLLVLEQPELHLQPGVHGKIAELLCEVRRRRPASRMLVETHSGNIILQIQIELAKGNIEPSDVILYFVEQSEGRARVREVTFDNNGRPSPAWPPGFFTEHIDLSRELIKARGQLS